MVTLNIDWKYSSFHRAVNWGGEGINEKMDGKYLE